jgi:hypothetical protein
MSFLQPWMLVALPLAAIPIIIHLINQRRYQTKQWAAMMFLLSANRMNRGYARIRQWLILALRALAIAALVIAIGRPLASGSLGSGIIGSVAGSGTSNTLVLLDRSPSMQQRDGSAALTKLETGVAQLTETLKTMGVGRVVLIESNRAVPQELESPDSLLESQQTGPSDASADVPAMMLAALDYIKANELGQTEIWICSDLRDHDWRAKDGRWTSLRDAFLELGRRVRFRLLAYPQPATDNRSVRLEEVRLDERGSESFVSLSLKIEGDTDANGAAIASPETIPVTIELDGARSTVDVSFDGAAGEVKGHRIAVPKATTRGWGRVNIPADAGPADDDFYFTFDSAPQRRTVIVTADAEVGRVLQLAAEIAAEEDVQSVAEIVAPEALSSVQWDGVSLVMWQGAFNAGGADGSLGQSGSPLPRTLASISELAFGGEGLGVRGRLGRATTDGHREQQVERTHFITAKTGLLSDHGFPSPPAPLPVCESKRGLLSQTGRGEPETFASQADAKVFDQAEILSAFVNRGGQVIFFPPDSLDNESTKTLPFGMKWGQWNEPRDPVAVGSWRGDADLLAGTLAGAALPVGALRINRFASLDGDATALATLEGGSPLLARVASPRGGIYICTTTPRASDSSLAADGVVLYVMVQRALAVGAKALQAAGQLDAGDSVGDAAADTAIAWKPLAERPGRLSTERAFTAGVYADNDRWWAVNRSAAEDRRAVLSDPQLDQLFQGLVLARVNEQAGTSKSLVEEIWRAFLVVMLAAMIGEACLCLPRKITEAISPMRGGATA